LAIQCDFQRLGGRFQEQQWDGSGGETVRDYAAGASVIHFQIVFQCITDEGENFVQLEEELLGRAPRGRVYRAERFEARKELCTEGVNT